MLEFAPYYFTIYMAIVIILTLFQYSMMQSCQGYSVLYRYDDYMPIVLLSVFLILFLGFRPISVLFGDTVNYNSTYIQLQTDGTFNSAGSTDVGGDWLFYTFMALCAQVIDIHFFFVIIMSMVFVMVLHVVLLYWPWQVCVRENVFGRLYYHLLLSVVISPRHCHLHACSLPILSGIPNICIWRGLVL